MLQAHVRFWSRRCGEMLKVDPTFELQGVKDKINIININRGGLIITRRTFVLVVSRVTCAS